MRKIVTLFFVYFIIQGIEAQTPQQLLDSAKLFPKMPKQTIDLIPLLNPPRFPTFASGTPFNDVEYTSFDTDYIEGETNGYDVFCPVDPADALPGTNTVKLVLCVSSIAIDRAYGGARGDKVILGTADKNFPFFLRGADLKDNDYAVIRHFDFNNGHIQLQGQASDYSLLYAKLSDGVQTEGWYLFYTKNGVIDLVAFIFPCWDVDDAGSLPPQIVNSMCNSDSTIRLSNLNHFRYAQPVPATPAFNNGITQFGSAGREIADGVAVDKKGYIYTYGATDGNLAAGNELDNEMFIAKYDPAGNRIWVTEIGNTNGDLIFDAATDDNYLYAVGRTLGALPGFTNKGGWDGIIIKIDLNTGQVVDTDQWGNEGLDGYGNVTLDDAGNLYVSGAGSPVGQSQGDSSFVVAKHSAATLDNIWRRLDPVLTTSTAVAEAWGGITYVPGTSPGNGKIVVGGWFINQPTAADGWLKMYGNVDQPTPTIIGTQVIKSPNLKGDWVLDNVADKDGNIYAVGYTTGDLQGTQQGEGDMFAVKLSPTLTNPVYVQWSTTKSDMFRRMEIDNAGNLYAMGYTYGDYSMPGYQGIQNDATGLTGDIVIQKFDNNLGRLKALQFGTVKDERGYPFVKDSVLYVAGMTEGSMVKANLDSYDAFIMAFKTSDLTITTPGLITGVGNINHTNPFIVYPNPVTDMLYITGLSNTRQQYAIYNSTGQLVQSGTNLTAANNRINTTSLPGGLYSIMIIINGKETTTKFLKSNK